MGEIKINTYERSEIKKEEKYERPEIINTDFDESISEVSDAAPLIGAGALIIATAFAKYC